MNIERFLNDLKPELIKYLGKTDCRYEDLTKEEVSLVFDDSVNELYTNICGRFKRFVIEKIDDVSISGVDSDTIIEYFGKKIGLIITSDMINDLRATLYVEEVNSDAFTFKSEGIVYAVQE